MAFSEIAKFAPAIGQTIAKIPEPEDPGVIAWLDLFGVEVPVGFQFASALGMKGPLAWILDFATDPTTWALGGVTKIGSLSKAGLAAAGSARLAETAARSAKYGGELLPKLIRSSRAAKKAQQISELSATFAGRTAEEVGNIWGKIMGVGARLESDSFKNVARILRSDNKGKILKELDDLVARGTKGESVLHPHIVDLKRINTLVRRNELSLARGLVDGEIAKRMTLTDRLRRYGQAVQGGDVKEIRRLGKEIRKLRPSPAVARAVEKKGVDEAVELARLFRGGGKPGVLKGGLASEAAAGQRNLLALKIPFSGAEIPIIVGQKPFKWMDWVRNRAPSIRLRPVVEGARNVGLPSEALRAAEASTRGVANVDTVSSMTDASIDVMRGIQDATVHATENLYNVDTWESQAAEVVAEGLRREFVAAMPELADRKEVLLSIVTGATKMKTAVSDPERMAVVFHDMLENLSIIAEERGVIRNHLDQYFPRIVRKVLKQKEYDSFINETVPQVARRFSGTTRHGRKRVITGWDKFFNLAERGIIEIEEDPAQVIGEYVAALGRALADQRMAEKMLSAPVALERTEHSFPRVLSAGQMKIIKKKLPHLSDDLNSWYRFIPKADNGYPTKADANFAALLKKTKGGFWDEMPGHQSGFFMRHEEIGPMRRLFEPGVSKSAVEGEKITESVIRNGLFLNGVTKRVQTLFNAFHYMTLTESGTAAVGWPFLKNLLKGAKDIPGAVGEFVVKGTAGAGRFPELKKLANIYGNLDTVVDSVDHGLVLGALPFAEREVLGEALNIGARWGKLVGLDKRKAPVAVAQALQKRILSWDAGLWDVFHNGSKTFAYQELLMKGTQRFPNMPLEKIKQATAQYVNNAFGGQQWSRFWMGKRGQELMRLMLFAPDWTISNARVAWDVMANFMMRGFNVPFELAKSMGVDEKVLRGVQLPGLDRISNFIARRMSQTGGGLFSAEAILQADIRAMYARQYALRAGLLAVGYGNILNYAFSGHSMNENSEGRKRMIELPYEDRHGKKAYLAIFKQFREPFEMLEDFQKFVRYKSGLALRGSIELWTGRDIFGRPIAGKKDGAVVKVGKHIGHLVPQGLPFAAQELFGFGGRGSKGASTFQRVAETAVSQFGLPIRREFIKGRRRATPRNRAGQASPTVALPRF